MHTLTPDEAHYEKYLDVAVTLLMSPDQPSPSARALVERLGGSLTTANKAMRVFWGYVGRQLDYRRQYPEGMPQPVIKLTEQLMASARESAALELDGERQHLVAQEQTLKEQTLTLQATIDGQHQALTSLHERLRSCERERDEHTSERAQRVAELATLTQEHTTLQQQLARQQNEHEQLQARMNQAEQERVDYRAGISALHERLFTSEKQAGVLHAQRAEAIARGEELEARLTDLGAQLKLQERQCSTQQATIEQLHSAAAAAEVAGLARDQEHQQLVNAQRQLHDDLAREREERNALAADYQRLQIEQGRMEVHWQRMTGMEQQIADLRAERDRLLLLLADRPLATARAEEDASSPGRDSQL